MLTHEQKEARYDGLGGSDAAAACGLPDAWCSARELYHIKRREVEPRAGDDLLAWMGNAWEEPIARWYAERTGFKVRDVRTTRVHPELSWMIAHPDRIVVGQRPRRGLELKMRVHTDGWGHDGSDVVPDAVLLQVQHYMGCTGYAVWDVACMFAGREARRYVIPRDESLIERLIDLEGDFWVRVQTGDPPPHDYEHACTERLIDVLHPQTDGRTIQLPPEAAAWHEVLEDAKAHIARYESVKKAAKAYFKDLIGDAAVGFLPDGASYRRAERHTTTYDASGAEHVSAWIDLRYSKPPRART